MTDKTKTIEDKPQRKDRVCIVGFANSKKFVPWDKTDDYEYWGLNELYLDPDIPQNAPWSRWFELHYDRFTRKRGKERCEDHAERLAKMGIPVYLCKPHPDIPNGIEFPQAVFNLFPDYWTNSVSYMIALAIHQRFKEIRIYGVDMAQQTEYAHQRPSCELLIGWALGQGIEVYIPPESDLLKSAYRYGFEENIMGPKLRDRLGELAEKRNAHAREKAKAEGHVNQCIGARGAIGWLTKNLGPDKAKICKAAFDQLLAQIAREEAEARKQAETHNVAHHQLAGAYEGTHYINEVFCK